QGRGVRGDRLQERAVGGAPELDGFVVHADGRQLLQVRGDRDLVDADVPALLPEAGGWLRERRGAREQREHGKYVAHRARPMDSDHDRPPLLQTTPGVRGALLRSCGVLTVRWSARSRAGE